MMLPGWRLPFSGRSTAPSYRKSRGKSWGRNPIFSDGMCGRKIQTPKPFENRVVSRKATSTKTNTFRGTLIKVLPRIAVPYRESYTPHHGIATRTTYSLDLCHPRVRNAGPINSLKRCTLLTTSLSMGSAQALVNELARTSDYI